MFDFKGLTDSQVEESRRKNGSNKLTERKSKNFFQQYLESFDDPIMKRLLVCLVLELIFVVMGKIEWYDPVGIFVALLLATMVGTISSFRSDNAFKKLQEEAAKIVVKVIRNGHLVEVLSDEVVVGDIVKIEAGDRIPAEGRLVYGNISVDQSVVNGESEEVKKIPYISGNIGQSNYSNPYLVFRGTIVTNGEAYMEVTIVGDNTEYGKIAQQLQEEDEVITPLKGKLQKLADLIGKIANVFGVIVGVGYMWSQIKAAGGFASYFVLGQMFTANMAMLTAIVVAIIAIWALYVFFQNKGKEDEDKLGKKAMFVSELVMFLAIVIACLIFKDARNDFTLFFEAVEMIIQDLITAFVMGITIIVVSVPEGLPLMIKTVLSQNVMKIRKDNVLVKSDGAGIETAGSVSLLYSDKTGTMTTGNLSVEMFISSSGTVFDELKDVTNDYLKNIIAETILYNSATKADGDRAIGGNPTEKAVFNFAKKATVPEKTQGEKVLFSSKYKHSATEMIAADGSRMWYIKGAPEQLLPKCKYCYDDNGNIILLTANIMNGLNEKMDELANRCIRVLALFTSKDGVDGDLTLVGILGIRDEIRKSTKPAIEQAKSAGVQVVMITGDKKETAVAIAKEIGLYEELLGHLAFTHEDLDRMSDEEIKSVLKKIRVISRATPEDKLRMVKLGQEMGEVVGMTGDGVNDSPALKRADVGFAMGAGTEIAKEAADLTILDNNFASIIKAILYGRTIYKSIQKFIIFQLTINVAALLTCSIGPLFLGVSQPLTVIQMLWVNLVMDTLAAMAFGGAPALDRYLLEKPIDRNADIITREMYEQIVIAGVYNTLLSIIYLKVPYFRTAFRDETSYMTGFFVLFIFFAIFNSLNARTSSLNLFENLKEHKSFVIVMSGITIMQIIMVYVGGPILRTEALTVSEWGLPLLMAFSIIPLDLIRKLLTRAVAKERYQEAMA
ncbi:MAG: cation-translocating P-type ATPase [Clostridia bacterium]|nr:cation-translocating P-type ATPase [Clostridia bacterium]